MHNRLQLNVTVLFDFVELSMNNTFQCDVCQYLCYSARCSFEININTVYALTFAGLKFCGLPIFMICNVNAQALPVWSKFSWDETFADGY